ncbi:hypothetical protein FGB62_7g329 [Gracilaria domingensis]|nr:hypothetical protein FGB62_7g329 [Gracilaria domingensis]
MGGAARRAKSKRRARRAARGAAAAALPATGARGFLRTPHTRASRCTKARAQGALIGRRAGLTLAAARASRRARVGVEDAAHLRDARDGIGRAAPAHAQPGRGDGRAHARCERQARAQRGRQVARQRVAGARRVHHRLRAHGGLVPQAALALGVHHAVLSERQHQLHVRVAPLSERLHCARACVRDAA